MRACADVDKVAHRRLGRVLSPIDVVCGFLPIIGLLGDVLVAPLASRHVARRVSREVVFAACRVSQTSSIARWPTIDVETVVGLLPPAQRSVWRCGSW